jgi:hypothetical protein
MWLTGYKYDVAISLAESDLAIAELIYDELQKKKLNCYLYSKMKQRAFGENLMKVTLDIYGRQSRCILILARADFGTGGWSEIERKVAEMTRRRKNRYIFQLLLDNVKVPIQGDGYLKWNNKPEEIAALIAAKLYGGQYSKWQQKLIRLLPIAAVLTFIVTFTFWKFDYGCNKVGSEQGSSSDYMMPDTLESVRLVDTTDYFVKDSNCKRYELVVDRDGVTQIQLYAGEVVQVYADGEITPGKWVRACGPDGVTENTDEAGLSLIGYNVVKEFKHAALLYRFDSRDLWWCYISGSNRYVLYRDGKLEFLINDINQGNNAGFYRVYIYVLGKNNSP